jgi:cell division protein FtsB
MRSVIGALYFRSSCCKFLSDVPKTTERKPAPRRRNSAPKRPARSRKIVQLLVLLVASVIIVDGLVGDRGLLAMLRARQEYDQLAASLARQRAENARLRDQARRLREDPAAIEEIARRELGLIRPGERVFIVKDIPPVKPAP